MPRSLRDQARAFLKTHALALGESRRAEKACLPPGAPGKIHSVATFRDYANALAQAAEHMGVKRLKHITPEMANAYLRERAQVVGQKALSRDRIALGHVVGHDQLERVQTVKRTPAKPSRLYTRDQVRAIAQAQSPPNALATEIAYNAGLRAHELLNIRPAAERPAHSGRHWSAGRFVGREHDVRYTVEGKGGLVREVALRPDLAARLEAQRRDDPIPVTDRGIYWQRYYDIGGGNAWSKSFSQASKRVLGWSRGAHGLRHGHAQMRLGQVQEAGHTYGDAKAITSQELGHFRPDVTEVYLR